MPLFGRSGSSAKKTPKLKGKRTFGGNPEVGIVRVPREVRSYALSDFDVMVTLGSGTFGRVRLARHLELGGHFALKIIKKQQVLRMDQVAHVMNETTLLRTLAHPFIVEIVAAFQDALRLYILFEVVLGGELFAKIRNRARIDPHAAKFYSTEVLLALEYLHTLHVAYRSLKPENILIDAEGHVKLCDFGTAKVVVDRTYTLCGTPEYSAPEVIANLGHGRGVDWWGLGILIYEMLVGHAPFYDETPFGLYEKILAAQYDVPAALEPRAKDLIRKLLQPDRTKRLGCIEDGADAVKAHRWYIKVDWDAIYWKQVAVPEVPVLESAWDTRHFDTYPDSEKGLEEPLGGKEQDFFRDFGAKV